MVKLAKMAKMAKKASMVKLARIAKNAKIATIGIISKIAKNDKIAKIAEIEGVIFLKTFKIWVFFEEIDWFLGKSLILIQNRKSWQICCRLRIKGFYFLKMSSSPFLTFFGEKSETFERWKI